MGELVALIAFFSAWSMSAFTSSSPAEILTKASVTPKASLSSFGTQMWLRRAGTHTVVWRPPRLAQLATSFKCLETHKIKYVTEFDHLELT